MLELITELSYRQRIVPNVWLDVATIDWSINDQIRLDRARPNPLRAPTRQGERQRKGTITKQQSIIYFSKVH